MTNRSQKQKGVSNVQNNSHRLHKIQFCLRNRSDPLGANGAQWQYRRLDLGEIRMNNPRAIYEIVTRLEEQLRAHVIEFCNVLRFPIPKITLEDIDLACKFSGYSGLIVNHTCLLCGMYLIDQKSKIAHIEHEKDNIIKLIVQRKLNREIRSVYY